MNASRRAMGRKSNDSRRSRHLSRRHLHVLGPPGHQLQVFSGTGREERDLLEVIDESVTASHGPEI